MHKLNDIKTENLRRNNIGSIIIKMLHHFRNDKLALKVKNMENILYFFHSRFYFLLFDSCIVTKNFEKVS